MTQARHGPGIESASQAALMECNRVLTEQVVKMCSEEL